jgi:signal peptidase I
VVTRVKGNGDKADKRAIAGKPASAAAPAKPGGLVDLLKTVFYAVLIAVVIRTFAFEPFNIPSGSMIPTLLVGDYLFVSKYPYGYSRYSLPFGLPLISGRILGAQPERGDVVVFKLPSDNKTDYIKRIIGLPGDEIQLKGGIVHINGKAVERTPAGSYTVPGGNGAGRSVQLYRETLPNGVSHSIIEMTDAGPYDNTGVYKVPPEHFFAMGDNRDSSRDSRFLGEVGYVPLENLVGRAEFIFFSIDGSPLRLWEWFSTVRFSRLFSGIQ